MNSPRAASMPSLEAATMWPLVSRSITRMRGSAAASSRSTSRTAGSGEQSSTRISSQSRKLLGEHRADGLLAGRRRRVVDRGDDREERCRGHGVASPAARSGAVSDATRAPGGRLLVSRDAARCCARFALACSRLARVGLLLERRGPAGPRARSRGRDVVSRRCRSSSSHAAAACRRLAAGPGRAATERNRAGGAAGRLARLDDAPERMNW